MKKKSCWHVLLDGKFHIIYSNFFEFTITHIVNFIELKFWTIYFERFLKHWVIWHVYPQPEHNRSQDYKGLSFLLSNSFFSSENWMKFVNSRRKIKPYIAPYSWFEIYRINHFCDEYSNNNVCVNSIPEGAFHITKVGNPGFPIWQRTASS